MKMKTMIYAIIILAIGLFVYHDSRYDLTNYDQVVITQFGKIVGSKAAPGKYYKIPFIQKVHYLPKGYYTAEWKDHISTSDKKILSLKTRSNWHISNPVQYYKKLKNRNLAQEFVMDHVGAVEKKFIISHTLFELVGKGNGAKFKNVECSTPIELGFIKSSEKAIHQDGITLNSIVAKITTPN